MRRAPVARSTRCDSVPHIEYSCADPVLSSAGFDADRFERSKFAVPLRKAAHRSRPILLPKAENARATMSSGKLWATAPVTRCAHRSCGEGGSGTAQTGHDELPSSIAPSPILCARSFRRDAP